MAEPGVCVFAPSPILAVMIEGGYGDQPDVHLHPGGQGPWIANMLDVLEMRSVMCAPFGGEPGRVLGAVLRGERLELRRVEGGSNGCQIEDRRSGKPECIADMPSASLNRHEVDELCNHVLAAGSETGVVILTGAASRGVVVPDVYRRLSADLSELGITVVADLSGDNLTAALAGGVSVLKVSEEEIGGVEPDEALAELRGQVRDMVVVTRGAQPSLAALDGRTVRVIAPTLQVVDHRGAGDSMTAGIAAGLARGLDTPDALRLGAAAGATNVTRHGLASGRRDTIERVAEKVQVETIAERSPGARADHQ